MRLTLMYQLVDRDPVDVPILPLAFIGWEKRTGRKMGDLAKGLGMRDMADLVVEQLELQHSDDVAEGADAFVARLVELSPVDTSGDGDPGRSPGDPSDAS